MDYLKLPSPWGDHEKAIWLSCQKIQRSYKDEVASRIEKLKGRYEISIYGELSVGEKNYPLYLIKSHNFDPSKKLVLITGGVHGYETSGIHGALLFMEKYASTYRDHFNFLCAPCVSPWAYETINRWNHLAVDPNRSFYNHSPSPEPQLLLDLVKNYLSQIYVHFDLHETTDTDNTIFRPALEKRDGVRNEFSEIPDGFYVVGAKEHPVPEFQNAIIESVKKVTHIAAADQAGRLIGVSIESPGIINYDMKNLFLCGGISNAEYVTTTEVYPNSDKVTVEECNLAQVAAVIGGLDYLLLKSDRKTIIGDRARQFVDLLTPDNFSLAQEWLSPDCEYIYGESRLRGNEIIQSFIDNHQKALKELDRIEYQSGEVEEVDKNSASIIVTDKIFLGSKVYNYRDRLIITFGSSFGLRSIIRIENRKIEEKRAKLLEFFRSCGVEWN